MSTRKRRRLPADDEANGDIVPQRDEAEEGQVVEIQEDHVHSNDVEESQAQSNGNNSQAESQAQRNDIEESQGQNNGIDDNSQAESPQNNTSQAHHDSEESQLASQVEEGVDDVAEVVTRKRRERSGKEEASEEEVWEEVSDDGNRPAKRRRSVRASQAAAEAAKRGEEARTGKEEAEESSDEDEEEDEDSGWGNKKFARAGILKNIYMENFMCHERYNVDLGPNINFINGPNGSGKSAVVVALQTCLGVKPKHGTALNLFIKHEAPKAVVSVTILNAGPNAFERNIYGKEIELTRVIRSHGRNTFTLSKKSGKPATGQAAKKELALILDHFRIQINNPVVMMGQGLCREFLQSNDKHNLYKLFLKSTQLATMKSTLTTDQEKLNHAHLTMKDLVIKVQEQEEVYKRHKEAYHQSQKLQDRRDKVAIITKQICWAEEAERQAKIDRDFLEVSKLGRECADIKKQMQKQETKLVNVREIKTRFNKEMAQLTKEIAEAAECTQKTQQERKKVKLESKTVLQDARKIKVELRRTHAALKKAKADRELQIQLGNRDTTAEIAQRKARTEELEAKCLHADTALEALRLEGEQLTATRNAATKQHRNETQVQGQIRVKIQQIEAEILNIRAVRKNTLHRFGRNTPEIQQAIQANLDKFSRDRPPFGPLGAFVQVQPHGQPFVRAIEACIGVSTLRSYVCQNKHDLNALRDLMRQKNISLGGIEFVIQRAVNGRHNYLQLHRDKNLYNFMQEKKLHTVLELVNITADNAFNVLLDQRKLEHYLVAEVGAPHIAEKLGKRGGVMGVFDLNGHKSVSYGKSVSTSFNSNHSRSPILSTDLGQVLERAEALLHEQTQALRACDERVQELLRAKQEANVACKDNDRKALTVRKEKGQWERELENLKREGDDVLPDDIEEEVARLDAVIKACENAAHDIEGALAEKKEELDKLQTALTALDKEHADLIAKGVVITAKATTTKEGMVTTIAEYTALQAKVALLTEKHQQKWANRIAMSTQVESEQAKLKDYTRQLLELEERIAVPKGKTVAILQRDLKCLEVALTAAQGNLGDAQVIKRNYYKAEAERKKQKLRRDEIQYNIQQLAQQIFNQGSDWTVFRKQIAKKSRAHFASNLQKGKHVGTLEFDHKEKSLEFQMDAKAATSGLSQGGGTKEVKALSGGERAFSVLSFVLALADSMAAPFRVMDEFDVCMDSVVRASAVRMLVTEGTGQTNRQFIFITDKDLEMVDGTQKNIKLQTMGRPREREDEYM